MTIQGTAAEVLHEMQVFVSRNGVAANSSAAPGSEEPPAAVVSEPTVAAAGAKPGRKKAPAADAVIDQPAKAAEPEATDGLTVDEAREYMKKFAADGYMDQVSAALEHFGVKKVSDIDPDAKGAKSPKFSAFVAKIDELVKAKG